MIIKPISVEFVDKMGDDLSVVNAARVSFDKVSYYAVPEVKMLDIRDIKLISYLARHGHWSPFAHTAISLRIQAPIFVARQLVKHQVGLTWNEVSRRYVDDEPSFYFPEVWRSRPEGSVKQGSGEQVIDLSCLDCLGDGPVDDSGWKVSMKEHLNEVIYLADRLYKSMIAVGVAPEQARMVLPQNTMTEWIWTGNVMSLARVCKQRLDSHAQQETREVVEKIQAIVQEHFPVSFKALMEA